MQELVDKIGANYNLTREQTIDLLKCVALHIKQRMPLSGALIDIVLPVDEASLREKEYLYHESL